MKPKKKKKIKHERKAFNTDAFMKANLYEVH